MSTAKLRRETRVIMVINQSAFVEFCANKRALGLLGLLGLPTELFQLRGVATQALLALSVSVCLVLTVADGWRRALVARSSGKAMRVVVRLESELDRVVQIVSAQPYSKVSQVVKVTRLKAACQSN